MLSQLLDTVNRARSSPNPGAWLDLPLFTFHKWGLDRIEWYNQEIDSYFSYKTFYIFILLENNFAQIWNEMKWNKLCQKREENRKIEKCARKSNLNRRKSAWELGVSVLFVRPRRLEWLNGRSSLAELF